jgi:polyisoprenoid-binding protein YceI
MMNALHSQIRFKSTDGEAAGDIVIDLTTGQTGDVKRDGRMQRDILKTDRYPYAAFTAERVNGPSRA